MKNFTKQNFKTNPLWVRLLIMAFMLLAGAGNAWAAGFWGENAWNIKFYSPSQGKDIWINDNYDAGHGNGSTIDLGTFSSAPYLKGYWAKTWGYGNDTNKYVKVTFNNTTTSSGVSKQWNSDGDQMWKSESLNIKFPDTEGSHEESITFAINGAETMTCKIKYKICTSCCTNYYLQHPWNGGNWTWKELKKEDCNNNIYKLTANYGNAGCDYSKPGVQEKQDYIANPTLEGNPVKGDECIFTFDANNKTITITKVVKCETLTAPTLTVTDVKKCNTDYTDGKITISGYDANTYTYVLKNSSNQTVNKTYSSGYSFTKDEIGIYKVTMTRKDGTQCEAVTSDSEEIKITDNTPIGDFSVSSSASSVCSGTQVTLKATSVDGASYQWYLNGSSTPINGATKSQYEPTIEADATYKVVVSKTANSCTATKNASVSVTAIPVASTNNFDITIPENAVYNGQKHSATATVKSGITGMGAVTVKHYKNDSEVDPIDAGDYVVKMSVAAGNSYCAMSETQIGTFTINKANQTTPTITANSTNICGKEATFAVSGGESTGNYSYTFDKNDANATREGTTLKATQSGSVTLKVKKLGDNNYNESSEATETFNFTMPIENVKLDIIEGESATGKYCVGHQIKFQLTYTGSTPTFDSDHFSWILDNFDSEISNNDGGIASGATWTTTLGVNDKSLKLKLKDCNGSWKESTPITFEVYERPSAPVFNPNSITVCQGQAFTLPGSEAEGYIWSDATGKPTTANKPNGIDATTDYYAVISFGCPSDATLYTVNVNPLPTITAISVNNSTPVINEDVLLTVEGSDIARVEWSITSGNNASLSDASGNSVKLTSTASGAVTVTATAISINGCRATSTKEVTFSETEDCTGNISNDIQIIFYHPSTYNEYNSQKGQWWGMGTMYYSTDKKSWLTKDMGDATSGSKTVTIQNITSEKLYVYFESKWTYHVSNKASTKEDIEELTRGNRYDIRITSHGNDNVKATSEATYTGSLSTPAPLSAPAVKTVSATSEEGSGIVTFTGKIVKTGCAAKSSIYYGYQFKKADEEWPTSDIEASNTPEALKLIPCTNASATALNYQFSANVEGLENGNYHFRAYIINGYNFTNGNYDQGVYYGLDKLITVSTTKTPISNVTLNYCDKNGGNVGVDPNPMCKGAIAYVKLSYVGSKYSDIKWLVEGVETNLVTDEGDGVWSYEIQGDGSLSVELKNDANTDPAWPYSNKLPFSIIPVPTAPYISIDPASGVICQGSSATIKVENPSAACSYKLVEEGSKAGFEPYKSGDLKYTVQNVAKYYVVAQHNACTDNEYTSNQVAINQIISTSAKISMEPANAETTPWEPVSITVTADEGYIYEVTYTSNELAKVDGVIIKQNGDTYTYRIPRPTGWGEGKAVSVRTPVTYGIKAQLKVDGEANQCDLSFDTATITVKDEENEDCD